MSGCPHRLLLITASLTQLKSPYPYAGNPNRVFQPLVALLAGINVPGEETVATYLYQVHLYHGLESSYYGRFLVENDP